MVDVIPTGSGRGGHGAGRGPAGADRRDPGLLGLGRIRLVVEEGIDGRALLVQRPDTGAAAQRGEVEGVVGLEPRLVVAPDRAGRTPGIVGVRGGAGGVV